MSLEAIVWAFKQTVGNPQSKLLLIHMCDACNKEHNFECWHGIKRISERTEMSTRTVQRHLKSLCETGFISLVRQGGPPDNSSRYRVNCDRKIQPKSSDNLTPPKDSEVSQSHHSPVTESPQSRQSDTTSGDRLTPKPVTNSNGTQREPQSDSPSFSFSKHLSEQYGYMAIHFSPREIEILKTWQETDVTKDEFKEAHRIAAQSKQTEQPSIAYIGGIIRNARNDEAAKVAKPKFKPRPTAQTESSDPLGDNTDAYEKRAAEKLAEMARKIGK